jgi:hypothetical protein
MFQPSRFARAPRTMRTTSQMTIVRIRLFEGVAPGVTTATVIAGNVGPPSLGTLAVAVQELSSPQVASPDLGLPTL